MVPVKMSRILVPFEHLAGSVLALIAAYVGGNTKDTIKFFSSLSRPLFVAVERYRYHYDMSVDGVVRDAVLRSAAKRTTAISAESATLAVVDASGDVDLIFRVAVAVLRHRRSILYQHCKKGDADPTVLEWIIKLVTNNRLPVGYKQPGTGRTLLHLALALGEKAFVLRLITSAAQSAAGFDPWITDDHKRTVLHVAAAEGIPDAALAILRHVDPTKMEAYGKLQTLEKRTAGEEATHHRHTKLATTLAEALRAAQYNEDDEDDGGYDDYDEADDYEA